MQRLLARVNSSDRLKYSIELYETFIIVGCKIFDLHDLAKVYNDIDRSAYGMFGESQRDLMDARGTVANLVFNITGKTIFEWADSAKKWVVVMPHKRSLIYSKPDSGTFCDKPVLVTKEEATEKARYLLDVGYYAIAAPAEAKEWLVMTDGIGNYANVWRGCTERSPDVCSLEFDYKILGPNGGIYSPFATKYYMTLDEAREVYFKLLDALDNRPDWQYCNPRIVCRDLMIEVRDRGRGDD